MQRTDFSYDLPQNLIAQKPLKSRTDSRLLYIDSIGEFYDKSFKDFPSLLSSRDLLVFNDTRVMPARLFAHKLSGGKVEILIERILGKYHILAQLRSNKSLKLPVILQLAAGVTATVLRRKDDFFELQFNDRSVAEVLELKGHVPLPPYIQRADVSLDKERYQTVYARELGAVAAPTAGLHFDEKIFLKIQALKIETAFITLHVGAGTFSPMRVNDIQQHKMHAEYLTVSKEVCEKILITRAKGGRVIAVGTTTVRALETASSNEIIQPYQGDTRLFITPNYRFRCVDALLTNFHLPESTLLMLVCAFAGKERILRAYRHAVSQQYRFFSYGDAMFIATKLG